MSIAYCYNFAPIKTAGVPRSEWRDCDRVCKVQDEGRFRHGLTPKIFGNEGLCPSCLVGWRVKSG